MTGRIEVIVGPMFSGKTEELIRRARRSLFAKRTIQIFKPTKDARYSSKDVVSHNNTTLVSTPIISAQVIPAQLGLTTHLVGIDEAQFFPAGLPEVCEHIANAGHRVVVASLDTDWQGEPFTEICTLMGMAEKVTKLSAICICGEDASRTIRLTDEDERELVGGAETYAPKCRSCANHWLKTHR